jgi:serine/threonine-protein kinase
MRRNPSRCGTGGANNAQLVTYREGDLVAGKYRLVRQAGEGGMGEVWVANNLNLETPVAIKLIRAGAQHGRAAECLLREARAAAQLRHPAIVKVFDFGLTEHRVPYIVMELLDGESLRVMLAREGRLSAERTLQIMLPIADALAAAHDRGIIHRDLKPENIFLATDDSGRMQPKVVDFGVAKVMRAQGDTMETGASSVGTPEYMSPEQAIGLHEVDERTDVWAFCVVLYELLIDAFLFSGQTPDDVIDAVVQDEAPSLVHLIGLDEGLWKIIEHGLKKDRDARWSSMRELGSELAQWLLERGIAEDASGSTLRNAWRISGASFELTPTHRTSPEVVATRSAAKGSDLAPRRCNTGETMNQAIDTTPPRSPARIARRRSRIAGLSGTVGLAVVLVLAWIVRSGSSSADPGAPAVQAAALMVPAFPVAAPSIPESIPAPTPVTHRAQKALGAVGTAIAPAGTSPNATNAPRTAQQGVSAAPHRPRSAKRVRPEDVDLGF